MTSHLNGGTKDSILTRLAEEIIPKILWVALTIFLAGCVGGVLNALQVDRGFVLPHRKKRGDLTMWHPGWIGNVVVGGFSALTLWGLYGPLAQLVVIGEGLSSQAAEVSLSLSGIIGALVTGLAGGRILSNEANKAAQVAAREDLLESLEILHKKKKGGGESGDVNR